MGVLITGDCGKHVLTIFSPLWDTNPAARKSLSYQIKVRFVREPGKAKQPYWISQSPNCLVYSHCLSILNSLTKGKFCRSKMNFVYVCHSLHRALWNNIRSFYQSNKRFKKQIWRQRNLHSLLSKAIFQENFVLLIRERKPNSSLVPAYIHCETIAIYLIKVTTKDFKGSLMC